MPTYSLLRYVLAAAALIGACTSGLFGLASFLFQRGDRRSIEIAARLVPFNAAYLARLSGFHPERRTELLEKAASLNPYSEQTWLQLGFDAEFHHRNFAAAERYYLHAAEVSHLFLPRWTLTNFYFRRQDKPAFLKWARSALEITPYVADPIFTELWLMDAGGSRRATDIPNRPAILEQYLIFLMSAGQFASAPPILERLVASAPASDARVYGLTDVLGPALDRLLGRGYVWEARRMWQALSTARWIPFSTPDPDRPLTNGNFAALFGHGFDWVILNSPGVSLTPPGTARGAEIELSGDQAESCTLLQQWVAIGPDRRYRLQWNVDYSSFSSAPSGMAWHVRGPKLNLQSPDLRADERPVWDFDTPPDTRIGLLTLEYKRPLGETKARGDLALKTVSLQPR